MLFIKVLIVHPHMNFYGGAETVAVRLSRYLRNKSIDNSILTLSVSEEILNECKDLSFILPKKDYTYKLRSTSLFDSLGVINEIIGLRRLLKTNINQFDLVNFHNFPATWSLFPFKKPSVWMCNEPPDLWNNPDPSIALKILCKIGLTCDRYIIRNFVSASCVADDFNAKRFIERYNKNPNIINYGIDHEFFSNGMSENVFDKYELQDKFNLIQVGVLGPQKNQLESIKVIEKLKDRINNIKLILAGLGNNPYEKMLRKYISEKDLENYVVFTGHVNKEIIRDLYKACHIALYPVKSQGGWLSPFEALSASIPIAVSSMMPASNIISKEKIGVVTDDFVNTVYEIYSNYKFYDEMAIKGNRWVTENLNWDSFGDKMVNIFRHTLDNSNSQHIKL